MKARNLNKFIFVIAMVAFASIGMLPRKADAQLVCYQWSAFPNERYKLDVGYHSGLSRVTEEDNFGHAKQTAWAVHGKEVGGCGPGTMLAVTGTVIRALPKPTTTGPTGAHMGLEVHASRGDGFFGGEDFCRSIEVDCTTTELTQTPTVWHCQSRNEFDIYHGASTLTKVDETIDPLCSVFEDGGDAEAITATAPSGPASGLRRQ